MASPHTASHTFLALGQRYIQPGEPTWRLHLQFIVARLDQDALGLPQVTFRCSDGQEFTAYTEQIEEAVADGQIVPVGPEGRMLHC